MNAGKKEIEEYIVDAITERPKSFRVDGKTFYIYPVTLGKVYLLQQYVSLLELDNKHLAMSTNMELLRIVKEKKDICLDIISIISSRDKEEVFDYDMNERKRAVFSALPDSDIAMLVILALTHEKASIVEKHLGIEEENKRMQAVMKVKTKGDKNNLTFGGLSIFGSLIDAACERYGWTKEYVVWGIDYMSLRIMLADKVNSIYCSDEEIKKIPASIRKRGEDIIRPTKENMEQIKKMDWK